MRHNSLYMFGLYIYHGLCPSKKTMSHFFLQNLTSLYVLGFISKSFNTLKFVLVWNAGFTNFYNHCITNKQVCILVLWTWTSFTVFSIHRFYIIFLSFKSVVLSSSLCCFYVRFLVEFSIETSSPPDKWNSATLFWLQTFKQDQMRHVRFETKRLT